MLVGEADNDTATDDGNGNHPYIDNTVPDLHDLTNS
jgi:hypothetical protein